MALNQLNLYGVIGVDVRAKEVKAALQAMDQTQPLLVKIDSEGGSVWEGFSIANALEEYPGEKKILVEPTAFSIASYIVAVFDDVEIASNGYIMAHMPYTGIEGTSEELAKHAALLSDIEAKMIQRYVAKTGKTELEVRSILEKETFLNADESVALGLASSVSASEKPTRMQPSAQHKSKLPMAVFAALFPSQEKQPMAQEQPQPPQAATVQEIKQAFPKAKSDFIVRCLEKSMPLASVATAAAEELMAENEELMAKVAAMEEEMKAMQESKPEAMDDEEKPEAMEEGKSKPEAKTRGAKPVAHATSTPLATATEQWDEAVAKEIADGKPRAKAVLAANRRNPGLRARMLAESNA